MHRSKTSRTPPWQSIDSSDDDEETWQPYEQRNSRFGRHASSTEHFNGGLVSSPAYTPNRNLESSEMFSYNCGEMGHSTDFCIAVRQVVCFICERKGHTTKHCPTILRNDRQEPTVINPQVTGIESTRGRNNGINIEKSGTLSKLDTRTDAILSTPLQNIQFDEISTSVKLNTIVESSSDSGWSDDEFDMTEPTIPVELCKGSVLSSTSTTNEASGTDNDQ